jgi:apolipoprotein N-acyltransferase
MSPRNALLLALAGGVASTFAFAPFGLWPLSILCPALLMALWEGATPRAAGQLGFAFGAGTFGAGTWWLYISIHGFGQAPVWLTLLLIVALVALMAAWYALLGWLAAHWLPAGPWRWFAGLPGLWLLTEWCRGWFLSGFPWLSLGYAHSDSPLRHWVPVTGVYGVSALCLLQAGALLALWRGRTGARAAALGLVAAAWGGAWALAGQAWTHPVGAPVAVAIVQGAIPQDQKWIEDNLEPTEDRYRALADQGMAGQGGKVRLLVLPESAIPEIANEIAPYLAQLHMSARQHDADILMGAIREADNRTDYYNSILGLTGGVAFYDKRHLVPFAEYFPVPHFVRSWLRLMSLPYADFTAGIEGQHPLHAAGLLWAPTICYEDAFGNDQRALVAASAALVNVTNDAWFGHSPARYQHLQIARLRALEAGRDLLRAANDGVSAVIGPDGDLRATAPEYQPAVLHGTVQGRGGQTPYTAHGDWPLVILGLLAAAAAAAVRMRRGPP